MTDKKNILLLFPRFEEGFIMGKVPLGLAYIASYLKARGHYVEAYNLIVDPIEKIDFGKFDYCGITCLTSFIAEIRRISAIIKQQNPDIKIVLGGPHPSIRIRDSLEISQHIDFVIVGEGELSFTELVESEDPVSGEIAGVYFMQDGKLKGRPSKPIKDLDTLPIPDQRIFDHGRLEKRNPFRAILASRGCPFKCFNCQPLIQTILPYRLRSPQAVVKEMVFLNKTYGQDYFGFIDSEFPMNKKWFRQYHDLIIESGIKFRFHCNARSDIIDEQIIKGYKDMDITRLAIGVESGNQRVVDKVLNKRIDLNNTREIFRIAAKHKVTTHAHFMLGIPGETLEEMQDSLDYAQSIPVTSVEFNILTPWPGTRFYELCQEKGWLAQDLRFEDYNEKRLGVVSTDKWNNEDVMGFYRNIRETLVSKGWHNSPDGSVYFRPGEKMPDNETIEEIRQQDHTG